MSVFVKVPGTTIELGGERYVLPPMALGVIEQLGDRFAEFADTVDFASPGRMKMLIDMIHGALLRNYPEMPRDTVSSNVDLASLKPTLEALMNTSGLSKEVQDEPSGEAPATGQDTGST